MKPVLVLKLFYPGYQNKIYDAEGITPPQMIGQVPDVLVFVRMGKRKPPELISEGWKLVIVTFVD
jgi:hypothetical protein